jgi:hypothetical protein
MLLQTQVEHKPQDRLPSLPILNSPKANIVMPLQNDCD